MNKKQKITLVTSLSLLLMGNVSAKPNQQDIKIEINGKSVISDVAPFVDNNRTLVPIRVISENLGYNVNWDNQTQKVTVKNENKVVELTIGKKDVNINGNNSSIDVAPMIKNDRTFVPLRFISESFGNDVKWDNDSRVVKIDKKVVIKSDTTNNTNKITSNNVKSNSNNVIDNKSSVASKSTTTNNDYIPTDPIAERKKVDAKLFKEIVDNLKFDESFYDMNSTMYAGFGGTVQNNSPYVIESIGREFKTKGGYVFYVGTTSSIPIGGVSETSAIGVRIAELSKEDSNILQCSRYTIKIIMPDGSERLLVYNGITNQVE